MNKMIFFLCLCLIFLGNGCSQDNTSQKASEKDAINMENTQNENTQNEDIPTADLDAANQENPSVLRNEIENKDLVTTSVDRISSSELNITYTNKTKSQLKYGKGRVLQVLNTEQQEFVPIEPREGWKDIAFKLDAGKSFEEVIDLKRLYGELKAGHYRIIKEMSTESSKINVTVEFDIK